jgi:glucose-1-phosphate cytidylyltransferase
MRTVILCGGLGTRLSEETQLRPKPMVEVGGKPILWHIMKMYERHGFNNFTLALGYKAEVIKDYFINYHARLSDLQINLGSGDVNYSNPIAEDWNVSLINTGLTTMTGGRLLRLRSHLEPSGTFMLTYGDGVSDVNIQDLLKFHRSHGRMATVTAVRPGVRFGELTIDGSEVTKFQEKPQGAESWVNGGFFVFEPEVFDFIDGDETMLEREPLERIAEQNQLMAYHHPGYWQCMDTIRDKHKLEELWDSGNALWKGLD